MYTHEHVHIHTHTREPERAPSHLRRAPEQECKEEGCGGGVHSHWQRQHEAVAVREACLWVLSQHPLGHWPPPSPLHSLSSPKAQEPAQAPCLKQTLGAEHRPEGTRPLARLAWACQYTRRVSPALRHQPHGLSPPTRWFRRHSPRVFGTKQPPLWLCGGSCLTGLQPWGKELCSGDKIWQNTRRALLRGRESRDKESSRGRCAELYRKTDVPNGARREGAQAERRRAARWLQAASAARPGPDGPGRAHTPA